MICSVFSLFLYILEPETALAGSIILLCRYLAQLIRLYVILKQ